MTIERSVRHRWAPSPVRLLTVLAGLWLYGVGEALMVLSALGNSPWTVLAQGVARQSRLSIGVVTNLVGAALLLLWVPLRQRPGLGTVLNVVLVGTSIDVTLTLLPHPHGSAARTVLLIGGIVTVAVASGLYLGAALGPGPRDGLMTGLHRVTGRSITVCRVGIEGTVLLIGFLLGGRVGIGTVLFAALIGPSVQLALRLFSRAPTVSL